MSNQGHVEEGYAADSTMISQNSPYQPTTQPMPDRRQVACLTLDLKYVKSRTGILTFAVVGLSLITVIFAAIARSNHSFTWSIALFCFVLHVIFAIVFAFRFFEKLNFIDWETTIMWNGALDTILLLIAACISAANAGLEGVGIFTTILAFVLCALVGYKTYMDYLTYKKKQAQRQQPATVSHVKGAEI